VTGHGSLKWSKKGNEGKNFSLKWFFVPIKEAAKILLEHYSGLFRRTLQEDFHYSGFGLARFL
jgi:hypothetical protein